MLYTLTRPFTWELFGLEVWMQHMPSPYLMWNILLEFEAPRYVILLYTLTHPVTRESNKLEVWMRIGVECLEYVIYFNKYSYFTLMMGGWDLNLWPLVKSGSNTISRDQLNQKLKLMVKTSEYVIYSKNVG